MDGKIFKTVVQIVKAFKFAVLLNLALDIGQIFVGNYTFVAFQRLLDGIGSVQALPNPQLTDLTPLLVVFVAVNLLNHALIYLEGVPGTMLSKGVVQWVKLRALDKLARIDYQAYQNLGTGNLIQIIENGSGSIYKILNGFYLGMLRGVAQIVIALYFIRSYDQTLFAVILAGYGLFYLFSYYLMKFLKQEVEKMLSNQEDFSSYAVRVFMELVVFRVNGRFKAEYERLKITSDQIVRSRVRVYLLQELSYTGFALLIFLVEAAVVVQQVSRILAGESTLGTLVALTGFIRVVFSPIIGFGQAWMEYRLDTVAFQRLDNVLTLPDDPGLERGKELTVRDGGIAFEQVSFAYPGHDVLRDFSLAIEGGRTTALVGTSGSGKSTLVRLLLHLLKPQAGQVRVDGHDLAGVHLGSYYRSVAYVPQEPPIFDGSIRENLTFGRPASAERLEEVIRQVGLNGLIGSLAQGLETRVGERGIKLSGGERQRLAFARVLLQEPRIVILDEPTSSLDSVTEDLVTQQMANFLKGKTVIVVAHRLQTVKNADQILVLEQGQVVQQGRFESLLAQEGKFRQLWEMQVREKAL